MAANTMDLIKRFRDDTGLGLSDCKKAVGHAVETCGENAPEEKLMEAARDFMRKLGRDKQMKKGGRSASQGKFFSYVHHNGALSVMVELNCETDFVANNNAFKEFGQKLALHIVACNPVSVSPEDVPANILAKEKEIFAEQIDKGKPEEIRNKILEGKVQAYYKDNCLLSQEMFGDERKRSVNDAISDLVAKTGENVQVRRFIRWELGK